MGHSMYQRIHDHLFRQAQALRLLCTLENEEYDLLAARDVSAIASLEFSLQELIRQIAAEKSAVIHLLQGGKVLDYAALLPAEQGGSLRSLHAAIDRHEQQASRAASRNARLSLALLDQNQRVLQELSSKAIPRQATTYGRRGVMCYQKKPEASIISGSL